MSNYANVTIEGMRNCNMDTLSEAVEKLGYSLKVEDSYMKTRYGEGDNICARLIDPNSQALEIGFKKVPLENNEYDIKLVGEFWHTGLSQNQFMDDVRREYRVLDIKDTLERYGYYFDFEAVDEENNIVMECYA